MRTVLASLLLLFLTAGAVAQSAPSLAGHWRLDPLNSTGDTTRNGNIIITQQGNALEFQYFTGVNPSGTETFVADNKPRTRYKNRMGNAYARARWDKGGLLITTDTSLNNEGTQSFSETERWSVSKDGKILTAKSGDGKILVYTKQADEVTQ